MDSAHELPQAQYANFWWRIGAYIVDSVLVGLGTQIIYLLLGIRPVMDESIRLPRAEEVGALLVALVGTWLYFALMESSKRQGTLGKSLLGLIVTDSDGKRLSFERATGRFFGKFISSLTLGIGYLMVLWTRKRQGLHDIMAKTLVLKR